MKSDRSRQTAYLKEYRDWLQNMASKTGFYFGEGSHLLSAGVVL